VVRGGFRLLGGRANDLVVEQGRRAVAIAAGRPVLDVPVGTAYFTCRAARGHSGVIVAADYAWGMVAEAARATRRTGTPNIAPVQADIHHLPLADRSFPAVLCTNGLQVIPDLTGALAELVRVLEPGGTLMLSVILAPLGAALPSGAENRLPTLLRSVRSFVDAVESAGLTVVRYQRERLAHLLEATKP
jgi:ubiquinone/menaquinone biosynthesis C-methylase UbiE